MRYLARLTICIAILVPSIGSAQPPTAKVEWAFDRQTKLDPLLGLPRIEQTMRMKPDAVYALAVEDSDFGFALFVSDDQGRPIAKADEGEESPTRIVTFVGPKSGACNIAVVSWGDQPGRVRAVLREATGSDLEDHRSRSLWNEKNATGHALLRAGKPEEAAQAFAELTAWTDEHYSTKAFPNGHPLRAACWENLGDIAIARGRLADAEKAWRHVLAIRRGLFPDKRFPLGHPLLADTVNGLGYMVEAQGRHAESVELFRESLGMRQALFPKARFPNGHLDLANSWNNLGAAYASQGAMAQAELCYRDALKIREAFYTKDLLPRGHPALAGTMNNLGLALYDQGNYADAEMVFRAAHSMYARLYPPSDHPAGHPDLANALNNLAATCLALGDLARAEQFHRESLKIHESLFDSKRFPKGHPALARSFNNVGFVRLHQGATEDAAKLFRASLEMRERWFDKDQYPRGHLDIANSHDNLGLALLTQGAFAQAEPYFRKSAAMVRDLAGDAHALASSSRIHLADSLRKQLRIDEAIAEAEEGWRCYRLARLRAQASGLERTGFAAEHSPAELLAVLQAKAGKAVAAWNTFEEDRSQGLLDDLMGKANRPLSAEDQDREKQLIAALAQAERLLLARPGDANDSDAGALRKACDAASADLLRFRQDVESRYGPRLGQRYDLAKIQAAIPPHSAIVGWVDVAGHPESGRGQEHWAVILRAAGEPNWISLPPLDGQCWNSRDDAVVESCRRDLHDTEVDWNERRTAAMRQRLQPLDEHLKDVRRLIVLPSRRMAGIPVEALTDRYLVSYAPSATLFAWLREKRSRAKDSLLIVADATYSAPHRDTPDRALLQRGETFLPLPGSAKEAAALSSWAKERGVAVDVLAGSQATASNLLKMGNDKIEAYRYLHIATHGKASWERGLSSFLALSREPESTAPFSRLTAGEILRTWRIDADLVTLSACETALGQKQGGEGYLGFSQALLGAGARTLVLSQGPVNDHAATLTMLRFYHELRPADGRKVSKLEALTAARRWLRSLPRTEALALLEGSPEGWLRRLPPGGRPFDHPHYWASFILVGDPD